MGSRSPGGMQPSESAPMPRLGEVFFDVRGSTRSMRLSWYAETGIAVFSIWQGGTCTGTFRLPVNDLPRLLDSLERGGPPDDPGVDNSRNTGPRRQSAAEAGAAPFTGMMTALTDRTSRPLPAVGQGNGSPGGELVLYNGNRNRAE